MSLSLEAYLKQNLNGISWKSAEKVLKLVTEGATIPFIARYRKDKTGNLDEVQIKDVIESSETFEEILKRKAFILKEINEQGNLTGELKLRIDKSFDLGELEEIYRPFKKKRKTKATIAREAGLGPLADWIWKIGHGELEDSTSLEVKAKNFVNAKAKFVTYDQILKGAQDIIVERIANEPELRKFVLDNIWQQGKIYSKKTKKFKANSKFSMYAEYEELLKNLLSSKASHRYLAMRRGWQDAELTLSMKGDEAAVESKFKGYACSVENHVSSFLHLCAATAYSGYVLPSISNEVHRKLKETADSHAIEVFSENVKKLLLASPFGAKRVLGVDPGIKTGCKLALIDDTGHFLSHTVLYTQKKEAKEEATKIIHELTAKMKLDAVAVGNGTAGRETEKFFRDLLKELKLEIPVVLVNESGASIYSASDIARDEFPELDLTVRGAISISRRLQDPLAELVKIDPKSIGVGQYQHDVSQPELKKNLDFVVASCVNQVGVNVNTASESLLAYVSGIGPALAKNIVSFRKEKGLLKNRDELNNISRFSAKVFEQAAGFLRVHNSNNPLDKTGIHPESYSAVKDMAKEADLNLSEIMGAGAKKILEHRTKWVKIIGEHTFDDIIKELESPGRDPRGSFEPVQFRDDIHSIKDLKEAMICPGVVTNVTNFGAFVDIGVHQDGLVHISELSHEFVEDPRKLVNPGDAVKVKILGIDLEKPQISFSMKLTDAPKVRPRAGAKSKRPLEGRKNSSKKSGGKKQMHAKGKPDAKPKGFKKQSINNPFANLADQLKGLQNKK